MELQRVTASLKRYFVTNTTPRKPVLRVAKGKSPDKPKTRTVSVFLTGLFNGSLVVTDGELKMLKEMLGDQVQWEKGDVGVGIEVH